MKRNHGILFIGFFSGILIYFILLVRSPTRRSFSRTPTDSVATDDALVATITFVDDDDDAIVEPRIYEEPPKPRVFDEPPEARRNATTPLKIFVLAGQSNVMGFGRVNATDDRGRYLNGTLEWMVQTYPETYGKLKTQTRDASSSSWTVRDDIYITYNRQSGAQRKAFQTPKTYQHGKLMVGYGGGPFDEIGPLAGPELGFGWTIGDALREFDEGGDGNVLIIKIGWGGKSLSVDFRSPSSRRGKSRGQSGGRYYEAILANVRKTVSNLSAIVPGYTAERGYEVMGFAWHHGWSDGRSERSSSLYESRLVDFIRDMRADLGVPDLPVSIGVSGMMGWTDRRPHRTAVIEAQLAVADASRYPEFEGTVASVETRDFFREEIPSSPGHEIYHWNNNCESYWLVGQAMGEAMMDLIRRKKLLETDLVRSPPHPTNQPPTAPGNATGDNHTEDICLFCTESGFTPRAPIERTQKVRGGNRDND